MEQNLKVTSIDHSFVNDGFLMCRGALIDRDKYSAGNGGRSVIFCGDKCSSSNTIRGK